MLDSGNNSYKIQCCFKSILYLVQNIDNLCFSDMGALKIEFDELYNAIFPGADSYVDVVRTLSENKSGLTRAEISEKTKISGAFLTRILTNLERCNFIDKTGIFDNSRRDAIYRLADFYTLFYFKFIEKNLSKDEQWWTHHIGASNVYSWMGLTFELICMMHNAQIKNSLGISGMATSISTWRCAPDKEQGTHGTQIDMIIECADRIVHLCEMKFSEQQYNITSDYELRLRNRMGIFNRRHRQNNRLYILL